VPGRPRGVPGRLRGVPGRLRRAFGDVHVVRRYLGHGPVSAVTKLSAEAGSSGVTAGSSPWFWRADEQRP
jgi:hypothetical protein